MRSAGHHFVALTTGRRPALKAGYTKRPVEDVTAESLLAVASPDHTWNGQPVFGAHLVLGPRSARKVEDGWLVAVAIELEAAAVDNVEFLSDWESAVGLYVPDELTDRLGLNGCNGWAEMTASGGLRVFSYVYVPSGSSPEAAWPEIRKQLPARQAKRGGVMFAELLDQTAIIAPSEEVQADGIARWETMVGGPAQMPTVTVAELHLLASVLDDVGDDDCATSSRGPGSALPARTAQVRRIYNRRCSDSDTLELLLEEGWTVLSGTAGKGEVALTKPGSKSRTPHAHLGGDRRPPGSVMVWTTAGPLDEGFWTGFDVLSHIRHGGSAVACAEALVADGTVRLRAQALAPRHRPNLEPAKMPTDALTEAIVEATATASHPTVPGTPFVLMQAVLDDTGVSRPINPLSVNPDGSVHVWGGMADLILAAVQIVEYRGDSRRFVHRVDPAVCKAVEATLRSNQALAAVHHVADRPVLTRSGAVVSEPGWHPRHQALIAMPYRDRARWATEYRVPANPSVEDVQQAVDYLLDEVLVDFPFDTDGDRARALACLLSHCARDLTPTQPAFLLDAADRGSGKTLIAEICRLVASGSTKALSVGYRRSDDEENVKQVVAGAIAGDLHLHIDELPRDKKIDSTFLAELVTSSGGVTKRKLGVNENISLPPVTLTVAGNNVEIDADWTRRLVPVRLVHRGEGLAHSRDGFRHVDIRGWVAENRPRILACIHTILLRSLQQQHEPAAAFGMFEAWSALIIGGLSEVTIGGVSAAELAVDGRTEWTASRDSLGDEWGELVAWWAQNIRTDWITAVDLRKKTRSAKPGPALPDVLGTFSGEPEAATVRRWGRALQRMVDTSIPHGGQLHRIQKHDRGKRGNAYSVVVVPISAGAPATAEQTSSPKASTNRPKKAKPAARPRKSPSRGSGTATTQPPELHLDPTTWEEI